MSNKSSSPIRTSPIVNLCPVYVGILCLRFYTSLVLSFAAAIKPTNKGCGAKGFDFSSGWNCTPMNHG